MLIFNVYLIKIYYRMKFFVRLMSLFVQGDKK